MTRRMSTAVIGLVAVSMLSAGCGYPGDAQDRAAAGAQPTATATVTVGPDGTPSSTPEDSSSASGSPTAGASTTPKPTLPLVDLSPETGTTYLAAHKAAGMLSPPKIMGPWVVQWHIDGDQVTYREINCLGTAVRTATGTLEDGEDGQVVRWIDNGDGEADDPWVGNAATETTRVKVSDAELKASLQEVATSDVDGQTEAFVGHCKDAGEDVVDFLRD